MPLGMRTVLRLEQENETKKILLLKKIHLNKNNLWSLLKKAKTISELKLIELKYNEFVFDPKNAADVDISTLKNVLFIDKKSREIDNIIKSIYQKNKNYHLGAHKLLHITKRLIGEKRGAELDRAATHSLWTPEIRKNCNLMILKCPDINVWKYKFRGIESANSPLENEIQRLGGGTLISVALFGSEQIYFDGFETFLKSINQFDLYNGYWKPSPGESIAIRNDFRRGMGKFYIRVYTALRSPNDPFFNQNEAIVPETPMDIFDRFRRINKNIEIAYVDNSQTKSGLDGTFWRLLPMGVQGLNLNTITADVDMIVSSAYAWFIARFLIDESLNMRSLILPGNSGPILAGLFGRKAKVGKNENFIDLINKMREFEYKHTYGDDEIFTAVYFAKKFFQGTDGMITFIRGTKWEKNDHYLKSLKFEKRLRTPFQDLWYKIQDTFGSRSNLGQSFPSKNFCTYPKTCHDQAVPFIFPTFIPELEGIGENFAQATIILNQKKEYYLDITRDPRAFLFYLNWKHPNKIIPYLKYLPINSKVKNFVKNREKITEKEFLLLEESSNITMLEKLLGL